MKGTSGRHGLPSRLGRLHREIAKFGAVGAAGVVVNLGVFNMLRGFCGLQTVRAGVIATLVAIACNYAGFRHFAYRDRDRGGRGREVTLFALFSAVGLVIENGVLYGATYALGLDSDVQSNIIKFVGIGVATMFRFWSYRSWVFRALPPARPVPGSVPDSEPEPEPAPVPATVPGPGPEAPAGRFVSGSAGWKGERETAQGGAAAGRRR